MRPLYWVVVKWTYDLHVIPSVRLYTTKRKAQRHIQNFVRRALRDRIIGRGRTDGTGVIYYVTERQPDHGLHIEIRAMTTA